VAHRTLGGQPASPAGTSPRSEDSPWRKAAENLGAGRVLLARPAPPEWYLASETVLPRDQLYRSLLADPDKLPSGVVDTSLLGDVGLRLAAAGVNRLLCLRGTGSEGIMLVENPTGPAGGEGPEAAGLVGRIETLGRWAPEAASLAGAAGEGSLAPLARWMQAASGRPRQPLVSSAGAQALAEALGVQRVVILRPQGTGVVAAIGSADEHRQGPVELTWPLTDDRQALAAALDAASSRTPVGPWQVMVATAGDLAVAVTPPTGWREALALVTNFLAAEAERNRTTREGRQRTLLEERMRIASLIHDGVTQQVSNVVIQLQLLELMSGDPERLTSTLRSAREATQAALEDLRASLYELAPRLPDWDDLATGLRSFAEDYSAQWGIDVCVEGDAGPAGLDPEVMMLTYSVVQECLTNVRKHAEADSVVIEVGTEDLELVLTVRDDGAGFPAESEGGTEGRAMGLRLLRDRVVQAGGSVRVESRPGEGSSVMVRMPL